MKAVWNGAVLAESDKTIVVEGNHYFPPDSLNQELLRESDRQSTCPFHGQASYYDVEVGSQVNGGATWYYPSPKPAAKQIKDYVAFWKGVRVSS